MSEFVTPPPVDRENGSVAVVAPSSGLAAEYPYVYDLGIERLEGQFGLDIVEYPTATSDHESLYEHPEERARDVVDAFEDPEIDAVVATIGGNDQIRILDHLDPDALRDNPTRFFGISDNANLALYLYEQGIVSYYGGTLMTSFGTTGAMHDREIEWLERALFDDHLGEIEPAPEFTDNDVDWADPDCVDREPTYESNPGRVWRGGTERIEGRLWGGCLPTVHGYLAADRHAPSVDDLDGGVLLLETSERLPDAEEVRSMLLPMGERGVLGAVDGVIVGRAKARTHRNERAPDERAAYRTRQREVVEEVLTEYNPDAPIVFDVDVGHTTPTAPLPIGGTVTLDPDEERIIAE